MCGIICALNINNNEKNLRKQVLHQAKKLRHRGPDWSGIFSDKHAILAHERLSIVDIVHGAQPLYNTKTSAVLAVNGEIYNHADLEKQLCQEHEFQDSLEILPTREQRLSLRIEFHHHRY